MIGAADIPIPSAVVTCSLAGSTRILMVAINSSTVAAAARLSVAVASTRSIAVVTSSLAVVEVTCALAVKEPLLSAVISLPIAAFLLIDIVSPLEVFIHCWSPLSGRACSLEYSRLAHATILSTSCGRLVQR